MRLKTCIAAAAVVIAFPVMQAAHAAGMAECRANGTLQVQSTNGPTPAALEIAVTNTASKQVSFTAVLPTPNGGVVGAPPTSEQYTVPAHGTTKVFLGNAIPSAPGSVGGIKSTNWLSYVQLMCRET